MGHGDTWQEVRGLFDRALDLPGERRRHFVEREASSAEIRDEVLSLLAGVDLDDGFLETPPLLTAEPPGPTDRNTQVPFARLGPWRLGRELGSGGMGRVFEAERADGLFEKRVAIKFIRRGMDSEAILQRFRREREILARFDHPGIARLLDGGLTPKGLPYFVMELVEGVPVTQHCREHGLSVRERLALFLDICAAVHFAHQNLVIHRDLKPSNLLVTDDGRVKLLDFGIARILEQSDAPDASLTEVGGRVLTPSYASPEQLRGDPVTTASDVYSLGVLLYEILTDLRPFERPDHTRDGPDRSRPVADAPLPSQAVLSRTARPSLGPAPPGGALPHLLRGDLDNIVMMAIHTDPTRRYTSASALAEDIARYLDGFPVRARPNTVGYRLSTFIRRNRAALAGTSLVVSALLVGGTLAAWQATVAQRERAVAQARFEELHGITTTLLFDVHDAIAPLPGATAARDLVVTRAFDTLARLSEEAVDDPTLQRDLARGYLRLASVLGNPSGASLGDGRTSLSALHEADRIADRLLAEGPADRVTLGLKAAVQRSLGDAVAWSGDVAQGLEHLDRSRTLFRGLAQSAQAAEAADAHLEWAVAEVKVGDHSGHPVFPNLQDRRGATERYLRAADILEAPPLGASDAWRVRRFRALVQERMGGMLRATGDPERALEVLQGSLAMREDLAREDPRSTDALRDVAIGRQLVCAVSAEAGRPSVGLPLCEQALGEFLALQDSDPANRQALVDLALVHEALSNVLEGAGDPQRADAALEEALRIREDLLERDPLDSVNRERVDALRAARGALRDG